MNVLVIEPMKEPYVKEIDGKLKTLQGFVGGLIQVLYPFEDEHVALICNDEGKLLSLPLNRPLFDEDGEIYDILVGTFLVVGLTEDDFGSLTDEMIEKYTEVFSRGFVI